VKLAIRLNRVLVPPDMWTNWNWFHKDKEKHSAFERYFDMDRLRRSVPVAPLTEFMRECVENPHHQLWIANDGIRSRWKHELLLHHPNPQYVRKLDCPAASLRPGDCPEFVENGELPRCLVVGEACQKLPKESTHRPLFLAQTYVMHARAKTPLARALGAFNPEAAEPPLVHPPSSLLADPIPPSMTALTLTDAANHAYRLSIRWDPNRAEIRAAFDWAPAMYDRARRALGHVLPRQFVAIHVRRADFTDAKKFQFCNEPKVLNSFNPPLLRMEVCPSDTEIAACLRQQPLRVVYVASDDRQLFVSLSKLLPEFTLVQLPKWIEGEIGPVVDGDRAVLDQVVASQATIFFGIPPSSFSSSIMQARDLAGIPYELTTSFAHCELAPDLQRYILQREAK